MVRCSPHAPAFQPNQYARPFDQNLGSPLIYFFYLHTTIRLKYMVLFHLIFLLCMTIQPKIRVLIDLFLLFAHDHSTKLYGPLSFILSLFCARPFDQKLGSSLIYFFYLYTTIRPKLGVAQTLKIIIFLIVLIFCLQYCLYISSATIIPLYFVHYSHRSAALMFRTLYSWLYEVLAGKIIPLNFSRLSKLWSILHHGSRIFVELNYIS